MANNYLLLSLCVEDSEENLDLLLQVLGEHEHWCDIEREPGQVYIFSEETCDVEHLIDALLDWTSLVQGEIAFTYAFTCSKPRPDEFGGGGVRIRNGEIIRQVHSTEIL